MFQKILIANRGEIACRVIRTARGLGIRTVAVYSSADAKALHVAMADEAHFIGDAPARESYLSIPHILAAASASGAEAVHPGYGFLSENADFAEACTDAGIVFIGPSAGAIRAIGDKAQAKGIMERVGVTTVPGYHGGTQDAARFAAEAEHIGYPVLIKAARGGGGRGMRVVTAPAALAGALDAARREAVAGFGNGTLILEKYLPRPRHVEVQVFGDRHGKIVHLFERDCSAQRRHQKVLEEAPAPTLPEALRQSLGAAAVAAARAVRYEGAGTVEFLLHDGRFYFIEMNTRLQVEHPVTEMIIGFDLVEWQLKIAAGEDLPATQEEIAARGHAMEARLYAEDPSNDFVPASGPLHRLRLPAPTDDLRIETGLREGDQIPIYYDALLAKLIAFGPDRAAARQRLDAALAATEIKGVANNRDFLLRLIRHRDFSAGAIDTGFIERHRTALTLPLAAAPFAAIAAASLALLYAVEDAPSPVRDFHSPWRARDGWRLNGMADTREHELVWLDQGLTRRVKVRLPHLSLALDEESASANIVARRGNALKIALDGTLIAVIVRQRGAVFTVVLDGQSFELRGLDALSSHADAAADPARLNAPVHGRVLDIPVTPGARVRRGQVLMLLECMKLEYRVTAPADGTVNAFNFTVGDVVQEGAPLLAFVPAAD
jgi:3-methylcrotonyl-CoA carboxylase alpha subunit